MLEAVELPAGIANLAASLPNVDRNALPLKTIYIFITSNAELHGARHIQWPVSSLFVDALKMVSIKMDRTQSGISR